MASDGMLEGLELCGQSESLTRRLNNILKDYSDGLAIPKEIIQNADDAGATEVTLIYDSRSNLQWRKSVLSGRMADCQGPSLWAHNNSLFTDADFENLLSLGGATKSNQAGKVGRFGLGFNAVYNLTDAPAVLSGFRLQLLDPHGEHPGRGFLEDVYSRQSERSTGLKLNFASAIGSQTLAQYPHQFAPYNGVMGCGSDLSKQPYRGTLIRLPLRTPAQAVESKICQRAYGEIEMNDLFSKTAQMAHLLLLFTQSVSKLQLLIVREGSKVSQLLKVKRSLIRCLQPLPGNIGSDDLLQQTRVLNAATEHIKNNSRSKDFIGQLQLKIDLRLKLEEAKRLGNEKLAAVSSRVDEWLMSTALGSKESIEMFQQNNTLRPPLATIAIRLVQPSTSDCAVDVVKPGVAFNFLPLPIETPLMFHVNAAFAVTSSRRHLQEATMDETDAACHPGRWNATLLREAVCTALVAALQHLAKHKIPGSPDLWPLLESTNGTIWRHLGDSFYRTVFSESPNAPSIFPTNKGWQPLQEVIFLDESLLSMGKLGAKLKAAVRCLAQSLAPTGCGLEQGLAPGVQQAALGLGLIGQRLLTGEQFIASFLEQLHKLWEGYPGRQQVRESCCQLLLVILRTISRKQVQEDDSAFWLRSDKIRSLLRSCSFLPNQAHKLCAASKLLDPCCTAASLFDKEDSVFPHKKFQSGNLRRALAELGLRSHINFDELLERAASIKTLSKDDRHQRTRTLLKYIADHKIEFSDRLGELASISFLPAKKKYDGTELSELRWHSESIPENQLFSPGSLYHFSQENLVSLCELIVDKSVVAKIPEEMLSRIGLKSEVTWKVASKQLLLASQVVSVRCLAICIAVYEHLSKLMSEKPHLAEEFNAYYVACGSPVILYSDFGPLHPQQVSLDEDDVECLPYLYRLPPYFRDTNSQLKYLPFLRAVGVRDKFDAITYRNVLKGMQEKYNGAALSKKDRKCSIELLARLSELNAEQIPRPSEIFAPDQGGFLLRCSDLCFGSVKWLSGAANSRFTHPDLAPGVCEKLGIPDQRYQQIKKHYKPFSFGQREKLTTRLRGILNDYPLGIEIFKELVQNADDAGATRLNFIIDRRSLGNEKIISDEWKNLQGPALVIVNDAVFSDEDINGIQNLGVGSKQSQPWKTGQYGIGFNCVYHVTDVPMFMSDNRVLCIMDPHCKYLPHASTESPGGMFKDEGLEEVRNLFCDVFDGFNITNECSTGSTIFRLPLRNKETAKESQICLSKEPLGSEGISRLFHEFKGDLAEILLFLTSIRTITLSDLSPDGPMTKVFEVSSNISSNIPVATKFREECQQLGRQLVQPGADVRILHSLKSIIHDTEIRSTSQSRAELTTISKWFVAQQLGLGSKDQISSQNESCLSSAITKGGWKALPKVGVAARIDEENVFKSKRRVFSLLPLPLTTDLPVHVNGHFVLDHSRRNLWEAHSNDVSTVWNNLLTTAAVPVCYASLLKALTERQKTALEDSKDSRLQRYYNLFPSIKEGDKSRWATLTYSFYKEVFANKWKLFPVTVDGRIDWKPLAQTVDSVDGTAAFLQENLPSDVRDILSRLRVPLVAEGKNFGYCLQKSEVPYVPNFNEKATINFLKGVCCKDLRSKLPMLIELTPIKSAHGVEILMKYLLRSAFRLEKTTEMNDLFTSLFGTPLNLTADGLLRVFEPNKPKFLTEYVSLFPAKARGLGGLFCHQIIFEVLKKPASVKARPLQDHSSSLCDSGLYKRFEIKDFQICLHSFLPSLFLDANSAFVPISSIESELEDKKPVDWLRDVWQFLEQAYHQASYGSKKEITEVFGSVWDIALVPTRFNRGNETSDRFCDNLFKLSRLSSISFDCGDCLNDLNENIKESLKQLKAPELAFRIDILLSSVGQLNQPVTMLPVFHFALNENPVKPPELPTVTMAENICLYLQSNQNAIERVIKHNAHGFDKTVRKLPIFVTLDLKCVALGGISARILPANFESAEMNAWSKAANCAFLKENTELDRLLNQVRCKKMSDCTVYSEFVLPAFHKFSDSTKLLHLEKLKQLSWGYKSVAHSNPNEGRKFLAALQDAKIIPLNGSWRRACEFYDHKVEILVEFLSKDNFLPENFKGEEWLELMKLAGLVTECSTEMVLKFANSIARLPVEDATAKSESLLKFVEAASFNSTSEKDKLLNELAVKDFIVADFDSDLKELLSNRRQSPYFTSIGKCVATDAKYISWSVLPVAPAIIQELKCFKKYLQKAPSVTDFWSHVRTLFIDKIFIGVELPDKQVKIRAKVMHKIYDHMRYLKPEDFNQQPREFKDLPCLLVDQDKRFAMPMQVTLYAEEAIPPLIFACSNELLKYTDLFVKLGATRKPTLQQVAQSLRMIRDSSPESVPDNMLASVGKCIKLLLKLIDQSSPPVLSSSKLLFLPASVSTAYESKTYKLVEANKLVINDAVEFFNRIKYPAQIGIEYLDLEFCHFSSDQRRLLEKHLASNLNVRRLSQVITEQLLLEECNECTAGALGCPACESVREKLDNSEIRLGISSVIVFGSTTKNREETLNSLTETFDNLKLDCRYNLATGLYIESRRVEESEKPKDFAVLNGVLYVRHQESLPDDADYLDFWQNELGDAVCHLLKQFLDDKQSNVICKLLCLKEALKDAQKVSKLLERHGIPHSCLKIPVLDTSIKTKTDHTDTLASIQSTEQYRQSPDELIEYSEWALSKFSTADQDKTYADCDKKSAFQYDQPVIAASISEVQSTKHSNPTTPVKNELSLRSTMRSTEEDDWFNVQQNQSDTYEQSKSDWEQISGSTAISRRRNRSGRSEMSMEMAVSMGGAFGGAIKCSMTDLSDRIPPSAEEARRYLLTAHGDAETAAETAGNKSCWACYQSWQAAEKALISIELAEGRSVERSHSLVDHLELISDDWQVKLKPLVDKLCRLLNRDPRYPHNGSTPYEAFNPSDGRVACETAWKIIRLAEAAVKRANS